jgi:hypothetical protein
VLLASIALHGETGRPDEGFRSVLAGIVSRPPSHLRALRALQLRDPPSGRMLAAREEQVSALLRIDT